MMKNSSPLRLHYTPHIIAHVWAVDEDFSRNERETSYFRCFNNYGKGFNEGTGEEALKSIGYLIRDMRNDKISGCAIALRNGNPLASDKSVPQEINGAIVRSLSLEELNTLNDILKGPKLRLAA
jgi:hypothetical protein